MSLRITGLPAEPFHALFSLSDEALAARNAGRRAGARAGRSSTAQLRSRPHARRNSDRATSRTGASPGCGYGSPIVTSDGRTACTRT
jgi:hypothetical protein